MIPTINEPGPFDALGKAREGEPIFVLLGRDPAAPAALTEWCRNRRNRALADHAPGSDGLMEELRQCADAEAIAFAMTDYRNGVIEGEQEAGSRVTHSGARGESSEQRDRGQQIAAAVEHLREAAYHVNEAGGLLAALGMDALAIHKALGKPGLPVFDLADALTAIHDADHAISPKRAGVQQPLELPDPIPPNFASDACEHDWIDQTEDGGLTETRRCRKCGSIMA